MDGFISRLHLHWKVAHTTLLQTVSHDTDNVYPHLRYHDISVGDQVLLNITQHDVKSLFPRGPLMPYFSVHINSFQLDLPHLLKSQQIHDAFNVSMLKKYTADTPHLYLLDSDVDLPTEPEADLADDEPDAHAPELAPAHLAEYLQRAPDSAIDLSDVTAQLAREWEDRWHAEHPSSSSITVAHTNIPTTQDPPPEQHPARDVEDIILDPVVLRQACKHLSYKPTVDLFANASHHQLYRYFPPLRTAKGLPSTPSHWTGVAKSTPIPIHPGTL